jgi:hypothetical protein
MKSIGDVGGRKFTLTARFCTFDFTCQIVGRFSYQMTSTPFQQLVVQEIAKLMNIYQEGMNVDVFDESSKDCIIIKVVTFNQHRKLSSRALRTI